MNYTEGAEVYVTCNARHSPDLDQELCKIIGVDREGVTVVWQGRGLYCSFDGHTIEAV